jgi:hypothetical protein
LPIKIIVKTTHKFCFIGQKSGNGSPMYFLSSWSGGGQHDVFLYPAMMAQWLEHQACNHKVPGLMPTTAMSSLGDWFTQPYLST